MAAETVNGYAPHQGYGGLEQANGPQSTASSPQSDIPKDEVGWYFVEQYYTTLSRTPEKLYLYYNKRSQYVSGNETDKVPVCVGQRAINDRIKELDFQDCKVRITNVDSQASDVNIVIQVIGEISNKSQPHRKFTQTFVLAQQTNGYFVLNDIFRYIIEEEDEHVLGEETADIAVGAKVPAGDDEVQQAPAAESGSQEPAPSAEPEVEPKTLTSSMDPIAVEQDAGKVDRELEDKLLKETPQTEEAEAEAETEAEPEAPAQTNGDHGEQADEEKALDTADIAVGAKVPSGAAEEEAEPEATEELGKETADVAVGAKVPTGENEDLKPEAPKDPEPTRTASPAKQAPAQPVAPPKPAAAKTWASLVGSTNRSVATPVTPAAPSAPSSTSQPRPTPPAQSKAAPSTQELGKQTADVAVGANVPTAPAAQREASPAASSQDEWTAVGGSHNRQQSRQTNGQLQPETQPNRAYIKNVHEGIDAPTLRQALEQFGELAYLDIARQKNCAFVDFKTNEGYNSAIAANPHTIGNDRLFVEERRFRPGSTPYVQRGQYTGRGRGDFRGGRGGFPPRGRGAPAPRGAARGGAQAA